MRGWRGDMFLLVIGAAVIICNLIAFVSNVVRIPERPVFWSLLATAQIFLAVWMLVLARRAWWRAQEELQAALMDVRVVRGGEELPAQLYHFGERDGQDVWVLVEPDLQPGDEVKIAALPPHTTVVGMGMGEGWAA